jgi:transposase
MSRPKKYPDELGERAVRLVFESQRPIAVVARDLGIHKEALRLCVRQAEADAGSRQDRLTTVERRHTVHYADVGVMPTRAGRACRSVGRVRFCPRS